MRTATTKMVESVVVLTAVNALFPSKYNHEIMLYSPIKPDLEREKGHGRSRSGNREKEKGHGDE